ncbi:hypothetical protein BKA62DRAFT_710408 [Auriculariales sp. MPI-PUGE-AT-0066]|nr:hypothetical protein BKA62DRAFT_710408 [Auriculariales sp. MPI-PUGE-AT-0066]
MLSTRFFLALSAIACVFAAPVAQPQDLPVSISELPVDSVSLPVILGELQDKVHGIFKQVDTLAQTGGLTESIATPILDDLVTALGSSAADLGNLVIDATTRKRDGLPGVDEVTVLVEPIITDINAIVDAITGELKQVPAIGAALVTVSTVTTALIQTLETIVPGVLAVVTGLVHTLTTTVGGVLQGLGLGKILSVLNL